jgi:hypothetical protein
MRKPKSEDEKAKDRAYRARKRAALTPEERADARRRHDANYRAAHAYERAVYNREVRAKRTRKSAGSQPLGVSRAQSTDSPESSRTI